MRLLIADSDPFVCQMITNTIRYDKTGITLVGIACNGKELLQELAMTNADIIILEDALPVHDWIQIIQIVRLQGRTCSFILTSSSRNFDVAYQAIKLNVYDFLLKPIDSDELNKTLQRLNKEKNSFLVTKPQYEFQTLVNRLFFSQVKIGFSNRPSSIVVTNDTYGKHFRNGTFRVAFIKFDIFSASQAEMESFSQYMNKSVSLIYECFTSCCHEVLVDQNYLVLYLLLNYKRENDPLILEKIAESLNTIKNTFLHQERADVTFGVSRIFTDIQDTHQAWVEAADAVWSRFAKGTGLVIFWEQEKQFPEAVQKNIGELEKNIKIACSLLDRDEFLESISAFFSMPAEILSRYETRTFLRRIENYMFDVNRTLIASFADADLMQQDMIHTLRKTNTLDEYKNAFIAQMTGIFNQVLDHANLRKSKPIRQSIYYIEQHFNRGISLHDLAELNGYSPVYFSHLFKMEVGENVTDYINGRRIKHAKELLWNFDGKISEIALQSGFPNPKYFCKVFKQIEGITPAEYKKLKESSEYR